MNIEIIGIEYQVYLFPTIKITHDKFLYGYRSIEFIWFKWSVEISVSKL